MIHVLAHKNLEKLLYRIILGYYYITVNNTKYKVVYPDIHIKYEAEILYDQIIEDNKYDNSWLTDSEIEFQLNILGLWNKEKEQHLKNMQDLLEATKIEIYLSFFNEQKRLKLKKQIKNIIQQIDVLLTSKNSLSHLGIKYQATTIKNEFLIMNSIYNVKNNMLKFKNPNKNSYKYSVLQSFIREITEQTLSVQDLRVLVKSDVWKSYVSSSTINKNIDEITDDYRHVINIHKMYESARQHPETPSEEIINDDDALDGWFIYNQKKAEKERKKNAILDKVGGNIKNTGEIFLLTDDMKESKDIFDLNETKTKVNIKEMRRLHKEKGDMSWQDLPFVREELNQKIVQEQSKFIRK